MFLLKKLSDAVLQLEKVLIALSLSIIFVALTLEVLFRYFFNNPLEWSSELAMFSLAWTTFIGGSIAIKNQTSTAVTILTDKLNKTLKNIILILSNLIVVFFCLILLVYSIIWLSETNTLFEKSMAMQIPMFIPYLSVPIGMAFMMIHSLYHFFNHLLNGRHLKAGDA